MTLLEAVQTNKMKIHTVMELLEKLIFTVFKVHKIKLLKGTCSYNQKFQRYILLFVKRIV